MFVINRYNHPSFYGTCSFILVLKDLLHLCLLLKAYSNLFWKQNGYKEQMLELISDFAPLKDLLQKCFPCPLSGDLSSNCPSTCDTIWWHWNGALTAFHHQEGRQQMISENKILVGNYLGMVLLLHMDAAWLELGRSFLSGFSSRS